MLTIRRLEERDIDAILAIQTASPEIAQWTALDYGRVARGEMAGWIAEDGNERPRISGCAPISERDGILNFAVHPMVRRRKTGTLLLQQVFAWGTTLSAVQAILEVRASNVATGLRKTQLSHYRAAPPVLSNSGRGRDAAERTSFFEEV